jgi:hypothetical protein
MSEICNKYGCSFELDLDGQVTCSSCGAMDDDKQTISLEHFENQVDFE